MEEETVVDLRIDLIKKAIEIKLGKFFDEESGEITQRKYDDITLVNRCGDVSRVTNKIIGGEIKTFSVQGRKPAIFYETNGDSLEIASAFNTANHAYVVDDKDKVWDPITKIWGSLDEKEFLSRLKTKNN